MSISIAAGDPASLSQHAIASAYAGLLSVDFFAYERPDGELPVR